MKVKFNASQLKAVQHTQGPLLVIAGAGSGKTSVITQKIAHLVEKCQIKPHRIVALTFTNKAAKEMGQRVRKQMSKKDLRGLKISTFHTFGLSFLRREYKVLGLKSGFTLLDQHDVAALLKELLFASRPVDLDWLEQVINTISRWKTALLSPGQAVVQASDERVGRLALAYQAYQRQIKAYNAVDFEDLIAMPTQLMQVDEAVRTRWQHWIHYLLVDEYQDTNLAQYQLMKQLVGLRECFTVVGDDDQSIYAWRGALPENLAQLGQDFSQLEVIKLEQNYRSTGTILTAANALIANNSHIYSKQLWSSLGPGELIRVWECVSEREEAEKIAHDLRNFKVQTGKSYCECAVLYRSNHQAKLLELSLQTLQIPYRLSGGVSFFSRTEIKDIMSYLRVLVNEEDDAALLRIINTPRREIGVSTLEKLGEYAKFRGVSLLQASQEIGFASQLSESALKRLRYFTDWLKHISKHLREVPLGKGLEQLLRDIEYRDWLESQASSPKVAERRWENVQVLVSMIERMGQKQEDKLSGCDDLLQVVVSKLVLQDVLAERADETDDDKVNLMTLHSCKGLEFPRVTIMGLEENILPHRNSLEQMEDVVQDSIKGAVDVALGAGLEEERRLFYVGITRAQRELTLTYALSRKQYGEKVDCTPSRFLQEIPHECLQWSKQNEPRSKSEQKQVANQHLSSIRALLGEER